MKESDGNQGERRRKGKNDDARWHQITQHVRQRWSPSMDVEGDFKI